MHITGTCVYVIVFIYEMKYLTEDAKRQQELEEKERKKREKLEVQERMKVENEVRALNDVLTKLAV